ncbi:MAG: crotonase/enoyl-CoA hydratase family protein [Deltaproteobacteria bacterium]|nr:crotonase/enoyl-CoA hydratase family protein [Deltaproteobacteria bacterium]
MVYKEICYEIDERVLTITLNRPEAMNSFTPRMFEELMDAFNAADVDDEVRAIIVTGNGRAFCAGADLSSGAATWNDAEDGSATFSKDLTKGDTGGQLTRRIYDCKKPIIAAINGHAVGVGITMTLPMDIRLVSETAKLGFVFAARGIVPDACSSWFLPRLVGISQALEWSLTGKIFQADEALKGGLVRSVHTPAELIPAAREIAMHIANNVSAISASLTRQMMWKMLGADHPISAHEIDSRAIFALGSSADAREGVESFLQKRAPDFKDQVNKDMPDFYPWWDERRLK